MSRIYKKISRLSFLLASMALSFTTTVNAETTTKNSSKNSEKQTWSVNAPQGKFIDANIDVTSGTWMNLDVSPDGKTLVFD